MRLPDLSLGTPAREPHKRYDGTALPSDALVSSVSIRRATEGADTFEGSPYSRKTRMTVQRVCQQRTSITQKIKTLARTPTLAGAERAAAQPQ